MPSPKFERVKAKYGGLSDLLDRMTAYVRHQVRSGQEFIIPKLAAAALKINEGEAFVLLKLMVVGGVLNQQYNIYCRKNDVLLESVDSLDDLDNIKYCDFCDAQHKSDELYLEIAFRPAENFEVSGLTV